jgi:hypothetical protein
MPDTAKLRCWIMGAQSRLIRCAEKVLQSGHLLVGVNSASGVSLEPIAFQAIRFQHYS